MRIAMPSPQTPDCKGGVFAVFAKIPPPIPSPAAHPTEASIPRGDGPHGHVGAGGLCSDVARRVAIRCRVVLKPRAHGGMRGGMARAWRRQWAAFGRDADRNADCRGGVFAVFAKIPPPIPSPATHPIEASIPRGDGPHGHVGADALCSDVACRVAIKKYCVAIKKRRVAL